MNVRVKEVMLYKGHGISSNGKVNLNLKADYSEIVNSIGVLQMLNNDVYAKVKLHNEKPMKLGYFRIKQVNFDSDGESTIKLQGIKDYIETDNLNMLPMQNDDCDRFIVMFEAEIEEESDEREE